MRVLVTGGTGYLGSAIVRALARRGHTPIVFARRITAVDPAVQAIAGDLQSPSSVDHAVALADAVCHTGALVSLWRRRSADFDDVNVQGTRHVLEACRRHGVARLVYTSSFLALPPAGRSEPLIANDYQRTKVAALALVRSAAVTNPAIVTIIPGVVYGPGPATEGNLVTRLLRDHLRGRLPAIVGADRLWSFAWVDDVADAHASAVDGGHLAREYPLGGEVAAQGRIFELAREIAGRPVPWRLPGAVARAAGLVEEIRARVTGSAPLITRGAVDIFEQDWPMDSRAAAADLGFRTMSLDAGIRHVLGDLT